MKNETEVERMERLLGLDPASIRKFENMVIGYFGLRDARALNKLREIVELSRELFNED